MKILWQAFSMLMMFTLVTGLLYPLMVTGIAQVFFPEKSKGSLLKNGNQIVGSMLIGQNFRSPGYFWPRPSTGNFTAIPSSASNQGPTSHKLKEDIAERRKDLAAKHETSLQEVPEDLLMASGSGLDPHISFAAAGFQIKRVAKARNIGEADFKKLQSVLDGAKEERLWGVLGKPVVNVLRLNQALDETFGKIEK